MLPDAMWQGRFPSHCRLGEQELLVLSALSFHVVLHPRHMRLGVSVMPGGVHPIAKAAGGGRTSGVCRGQFGGAAAKLGVEEPSAEMVWVGGTGWAEGTGVPETTSSSAPQSLGRSTTSYTDLYQIHTEARPCPVSWLCLKWTEGVLGQCVVSPGVGRLCFASL